MVVPIREVANKHFSNSAIFTTHFSMAQLPSNMEMDVDCNSIRGRSTLSSKAGSRDSSISSSTSSVLYYQYMEMNNDLPEVESQEPIDSSQLSYEGNAETRHSVSMVTDKPSPKEGQHVQNETSALKTTPKP